MSRFSKSHLLGFFQIFISVLSKGVVAVLGPQSQTNSDHIKSICDNSEIPFIETRPALTERHKHLSSINLHPDPDKLGDILGIFRFRIVIYIYELQKFYSSQVGHQIWLESGDSSL